MKIPSRGPVTVSHGAEGSTRLWYSREWRSWGVTSYDAEGNQVGETLWSARRESAAIDFDNVCGRIARGENDR